MRVHVVAVAGTGMGSLAHLIRQLGHEVSGSDVRFDPPIGPALDDWGVRCQVGFDPAHLEPPPDLVVVGNVCRKDNPEAVAAFERGLRVTHLPGALAELALGGTSPLVVAGTHGKTTTTALTATLLDRTGFAPGYLVGGLPLDLPSSARPARETEGRHPLRKTPFVVEGDEYDTAYFEKSPKFLHYQAEVAVLTSLEHDHVDIYPTWKSYRSAFERFVTGLPTSGLLIAHAGCKDVVAVAARTSAVLRHYALSDEPLNGVVPDWVAVPLGMDASGSRFELLERGISRGEFRTPLLGRHNLRNTVAALAAAAEGFGAELGELREALLTFRGVARRQQLLGTPDGVHVIDDFAHHPTAVKETLWALRSRYPDTRLFAVFEPRSATACRRVHQAAYAQAFDAADVVWLAPVARQQLPPDERLDVQRLAQDLRDRGHTADAADHLDTLLGWIVEAARPGDCIALLSNGAFGGIHEALLARLAGRKKESSGGRR